MTNVTRKLRIDWGATGVALFVAVKTAAGADLLARTSTGVTEEPAGSGIYYRTLTADNVGWDVIWDDNASGVGHSAGEWIDPVAEAAAAPVNLSVDETEVVSS